MATCKHPGCERELGIDSRYRIRTFAVYDGWQKENHASFCSYAHAALWMIQEAAKHEADEGMQLRELRSQVTRTGCLTATPGRKSKETRP